MSLLDDIALLGADIEDARYRFMDNMALYEKMLHRFPGIIEKAPVLSLVESGDLETALSNTHALKGVAGNLSLTALYKNYTQLEDLIREGDVEKTKVLLLKTLDIQQEFVDCINKYA